MIASFYSRVKGNLTTPEAAAAPWRVRADIAGPKLLVQTRRHAGRFRDFC
jgi:hypothetical protein